MEPAVAQHVGARLLGEIEEESLEELITSLQTNLSPTHPTLRPHIPIPALASLTARHHQATKSAPPPLLSLTGRYLPLLYHLTSTLLSAPHNYTLVIIDADHRFDVTRVVSTCTDQYHPATNPDDLKHLYVYRPGRGADGHGTRKQIQDAVNAARQFMLYGAHGSRDRAWWGTIVVGGGGGSFGGDVSAGWKGWLDVRRAEMGAAGFGAGVSVEEALAERERREAVRRTRGWEARSRVGGYSWGGGREDGGLS